MDFEFATATRIVFGRGKLGQIGAFAKAMGQSALIVCGRSTTRAQRVMDQLKPTSIETHLFQIALEPTVHEVCKGADEARKLQCDLVIGIGGGSSLDAAKAIAALLTNQGELFDYLEVVGKAQPLRLPSAPCITIPTTAGTGAEVTRNSVLAAPEQQFKVSLRSPFLLPKLALVDPDLTMDLPRPLTITTGLDALTQLIEPFVSPRATPLTDGFCREGLKRVSKSLRRVCADGLDAEARNDMALASLLSGLSLANAALGSVHGFAAPLGGMYSASHGAFCAALLPQAMAVNIRALRQRDPESAALSRYTEVAQLLTSDARASAEDGQRWVELLCNDLNTQGLRELGVQNRDFPTLIGKASKASSMKGNPIALTPDEMEEVLRSSF